jgi:hypothetical protein
VLYIHQTESLESSGYCLVKISRTELLEPSRCCLIKISRTRATLLRVLWRQQLADASSTKFSNTGLTYYITPSSFFVRVKRLYIIELGG